MGFSQLDRPKFEKYRLVKEEEAAADIKPLQPEKEYATKDEVTALYEEIEKLKQAIAEPKKEIKSEPKRTARTKKEGEEE